MATKVSKSLLPPTPLLPGPCQAFLVAPPPNLRRFLWPLSPLDFDAGKDELKIVFALADRSMEDPSTFFPSWWSLEEVEAEKALPRGVSEARPRAVLPALMEVSLTDRESEWVCRFLFFMTVCAAAGESLVRAPWTDCRWLLNKRLVRFTFGNELVLTLFIVESVGVHSTAPFKKNPTANSSTW